MLADCCCIGMVRCLAVVCVGGGGTWAYYRGAPGLGCRVFGAEESLDGTKLPCTLHEVHGPLWLLTVTQASAQRNLQKH